MESTLLEQYARTYADALSQNMPPDLAFVLLLIPKPDKSKPLNDAAFISNMPEQAALACTAEVLKSKAAEKMLMAGIDPSEILSLEAAAKDHVKKSVAEIRRANSQVPPVPPV
jgi:hypothetical protein